ncbi:MAG: minor capsid protein [Bacteroidales bacterium]|nr:minor capsid protein [Bacteroidales bacterium]
MIPEFIPEDYDPDNNVPEELIAVLLLAIPAFENARMETIIAGASQNYLKGTKIAYERLGENFVSSDVKDDVYSFLKTYKKQINEGYTIIQGEKVYWLRDRTLTERQKIFDIISEGITKGKAPDVVKSEFQNYFSMQGYQAERLARTETAYVQAQGRDDRYKQFGVKKVKWLLGTNPCPLCAQYGGKIYTWDDLPLQQPAHVNCTCDLSPVLD